MLARRLRLRASGAAARVSRGRDPSDGAGLAWAHAHGHVLARNGGTKAMKLTVAVDRNNLDRFLNHYGASAHAAE